MYSGGNSENCEEAENLRKRKHRAEVANNDDSDRRLNRPKLDHPAVNSNQDKIEENISLDDLGYAQST